MKRHHMGVPAKGIKQEPVDILDEQSKARRRKQNRESIRCYREEKNTTDQVNVDITNHHEDAQKSVFVKRNKQERADIQRNYRERKKKENGELFLMKERERKKQQYTPISMLDEQSKEKRRKKNRESVRRHREKKKTTDEVNVDITNQGNKHERGDIQQNCHKGIKKENGEQYLLKERVRKKQKYTPISMLDEQSKEKRRKQNRDSIRRFREKKKTDEANAEETNHHRNKQARADIQRNYRERKKKENGELFLMKDRKRKRQQYTPISMLNEQSKEKRRKQNRESVRRHREKKKTTDEVNVDITNQGNKQARADIQRNYHDRKKTEDREQYLLKERGRKKQKYTPISMLDEQSKEKRRKQNRESVRRFREKRKTTVQPHFFHVNIDEINHHEAAQQSALVKGNKQAREDIQGNFRERKKKEDGELFLLKERERKIQEYTPISMLDEQSKEKRRKQNRESIRRYREKKKTDKDNVVVISVTLDCYQEEDISLKET